MTLSLQNSIVRAKIQSLRRCSAIVGPRGPLRRRALLVSNVLMPTVVQTATNGIASRYRRISRSWWAPLAVAGLGLVAFIGAAALGLEAANDQFVKDSAWQALLKANKDIILTIIPCVYAVIGAILCPCIYYCLDLAMKRRVRNKLLKGNTVQAWAADEGLKHLFTPQVIQQIRNAGMEDVNILAASVVRDQDFLAKLLSGSRDSSGGGNDSSVKLSEGQVVFMSVHLAQYFQRIAQAMRD